MHFVWSCHLADLRPRNCLFLEQCRASVQFPLKNFLLFTDQGCDSANWIREKAFQFFYERIKCILWLPHGSVTRLFALKVENKKMLLNHSKMSFSCPLKLSLWCYLYINCLEKLFAECEPCGRQLYFQLGMFQPDWWNTNPQIVHLYVETTG